jgi:hypothetical protein
MKRVKPRMKESIKKLINERDRLLDQVQALNHKISGLELAISLLEQDQDERQQPAKELSQRGSAKALLLDLLREVGTTGLNATTAVEIAARRGVKLERGTAASNLSRMKADNTVTYDRERYRLPEFTRATITVVQGGAKGS